MSTQFTNRQWRLPNAWNGSESNVNKQSNYSLSFDGSSQFINIDTSQTLAPNTGDFTFSGWFYRDSSSTGNPVYFEKGAAYPGNGILVRDSGATGLIEVFYNGFGAIQFSNLTSYNTSNAWHHIALVYSESGNTLTAYVDGNSEQKSATTTLNVTDSIFIIGKRQNNTSYFLGKIDGVAIYNYALSSSQITTLYGSSSTGIGNPMSLSPKPVAYYPLGDQDAFNGANYLVPNSSLKDYVFDFNSTSSQYIEVANNSSINISGDLTLSAWINVNDLSNFRSILSKRSGTVGYEMVVRTSGEISFYTDSGQNSKSTATVSLNTWTNIILTVESGVTNGTKIYFNGVADTWQSGGTHTVVSNTNSLNIGKRHGSTFYFDGEISNAQIFNTALSSTDVETLYNNGSPLTSMSGYTSLQGWWKLDASATYDSSTTTWTIPDDSSNSNDGTSSGMTQANLVQSDLSFTSGYSPYALNFDGTNEKIEYTNGTIDLGLSSTETWWIKYSNSSATSSTIASAPVFAGFHILYEKSTNKVYYRIDSANLYYEWLIPSTYFTDNLWHHYAIVRDDSLAFSSYIKLYIDGNLFGSPTAVNATTKSTTNTKITDWGGASAYSGIVADFSNIAVWNISLSSTEVQEIFNSGVPSNLNNFSGTKPYSWWQLGSNMSYNSNWTILDEGTGNNNGDAFNISEDSIVDGVGSYANGTSSGMGGDEVIGDAPYSSSNSLSVNMDVLDRVTDTPS